MIPSTSAIRTLRKALLQFTHSLPSNATHRHYSAILSQLWDIKYAHRNRTRLGRGPSSGKGKTSGRGHKGQGQRSGIPRNFQGGQTPLWVTHPERGKGNGTGELRKELSALNLDRIQLWIDQGRIDPSKDITFKEMLETRIVHGIKDGVKLLGKNADRLKSPITITVSKASRSAIARIESLGGKVTTRFFTRESIKSITHPDLFPFGYRLPDATSRKDIEYYRDPENRGYLVDTVKKGETPSLFWYKKGERKKDGVLKKTEEELEKQRKDRELRKKIAANMMYTY